MELKIKIILCICPFLLLSACSFHTQRHPPVDADAVPFLISDIISNMPVDADTALANLKIDASGAVERCYDSRDKLSLSGARPKSSTFYLLPQKLELFGYPFEFSYATQNGKLHYIEFEAVLEDSKENMFELLKNIYHYINDEVGPPETEPSGRTVTAETFIKENKTSEDLEESWGCMDYWFFGDADKEIYFELRCIYREGTARIVFKCGDTDFTLDDGTKYPGPVGRKSGTTPPEERS